MFIHTNQLLITSFYIKRYLFIAELAMSQRWSVIFSATGAWGGKPIGRVRVNAKFQWTNDQYNRLNKHLFGIEYDPYEVLENVIENDFLQQAPRTKVENLALLKQYMKEVYDDGKYQIPLRQSRVKNCRFFFQKFEVRSQKRPFSGNVQFL